MEIYWIGGSPCCGKSTVAEKLVQTHGFHHYKLDDHLTHYMAEMAHGGNALCAAVMDSSMEQMWMRNPTDMCHEELQIYRDIFPLVCEALAAYAPDAAVVAEGAGLLPELLHAQGVAANRCLCMTPTRAFQRKMYARRPWIGQYLADCSDPAQAFDSWMERDALFSEAMRQQARQFGYHAILVDGTVEADGVFQQVRAVFGL